MNLCVPDNKKACAACCGIMNHKDISKGNLDKFLYDGYFRKENAWRYQIEGCYPEQSTDCRDYSTHICPFVGFTDKESPGCLIHPLFTGEEQRDMALFGAETCINYSCPAMTIFSEEQKALIIKYIDDWYLYTIAIIDPFSTIYIIDLLKRDNLMDDLFGEKLNQLLQKHSKNLNLYEGTIFCYSIDEYKMEQNRFFIKTIFSEL